MTTNVDLEKLQKDAVDIFNQGFACSESVIYAIKENFELDMSDDAIAMSSGFPWGLGGGGCICGALAGATMCIGYFFGRKTPGDPKINRCFKLSNEIHDFFKEYCGATCCRVLTKGKEKNSPERKAQCTDFVAATVKKTAEIILRELAADEAENKNIFLKNEAEFFNLPPRFMSLFFCLYVLCIFCTFFRLYQIIFGFIASTYFCDTSYFIAFRQVDKLHSGCHSSEF